MKVAVTGATGFLGSALVRRLLAAGHIVRAVVRATSRVERLPGAVTAVRADPGDGAAMRQALAGAEALIHAAALVTNRGARWAVFQRTNVLGPVVAVEAAAAAGVSRIVYVSSFLALGPGDGRTPLNESCEHPRRHFHNRYERSKTLGLRRVRALADAGHPVVIVYPGVLYGAGPRTEANFVERLFEDLAAGRLRAVIGSGRQRWSVAHVDDVAGGILKALVAAAPGARYVLGGENVTLNDLLAALAGRAGVAPPSRHAGPRLAWCAAAIEEVRARLSRRLPTFTRDAVAVLAHDWACDSSAARRDLGYNPRAFADGLRDWPMSADGR